MKKTARRSVLVVEQRHAVSRQVQGCLTRAGLHVLAPLQTAQNALTAAAAASPDVIVMNIDAPGDLAALRHFVEWAATRGTPIVYLSASADRATLERVSDGFGAACIITPFADGQLVAAVLLLTIGAGRSEGLPFRRHAMTAGEKLAAIAAVVNDAPLTGGPSRQHTTADGVALGPPQRGMELLSRREQEIVDLLSNGARVVTIAHRLRLSQHTVRNHLKSVFRKLGVHAQHELFELWRAGVRPPLGT